MACEHVHVRRVQRPCEGKDITNGVKHRKARLHSLGFEVPDLDDGFSAGLLGGRAELAVPRFAKADLATVHNNMRPRHQN